MESLEQSARAGGKGGRLLPEISPALTASGIRIRAGQIVMVAAMPNGGKSFFALWYAITHNLPTLYISADTDREDTLFRTLAMLTEDRVADIEETFEIGAGAAYSDALPRVGNVRFSFDPSPSPEDINLEILAFEEMWGDPPALLIIDNLLNVMEGDGGRAGMMNVAQFCHHVARKSRAAVLLLHHTSESVGKPGFPQPRSAVLEKINQLPEMILTTGFDAQQGIFRIANVKARSGPHDPSGETYVTMYAVADRMQLFGDQRDQQMAANRFSYV